VARWMDPLTGHFVSADTILLTPKNTKAFDRYMYVMNNPIHLIDPSGHLSEKEIMNYFGVTKWDDVIDVFEDRGALAGQWGWLATMKKAEIGDTIQFNFNGKSSNGTSRSISYSGALTKRNGSLSLNTRMGSMSLIRAGNTGCDSFSVIRNTNTKNQYGSYGTLLGVYNAHDKYYRISYDPSNVDWLGVGIDASGIALDITTLGVGGRFTNALDTINGLKFVGGYLDISYGGATTMAEYQNNGIGLGLIREFIGNGLDIWGITTPILPDALGILVNLTGIFKGDL
jgi:hypothetical protein